MSVSPMANPPAPRDRTLSAIAFVENLFDNGLSIGDTWLEALATWSSVTDTVPSAANRCPAPSSPHGFFDRHR